MAAKAQDVELHGYAAFSLKAGAEAEAEVKAEGMSEDEQIAKAIEVSILGAIAPVAAESSTGTPAAAAGAEEIRAQQKPYSSSNVPTMIDTYYLSIACKALIKCRRTLKNTYLHAYFLTDEKELTLLQHMQGALEENTERLAELLVRVCYCRFLLFFAYW